MKKSALAMLVLGLAALPLVACESGDSNTPEEGGGEQQSFEVKVVKSSLKHEGSSISDEKLASFVKGQYDLNFDLIRKSSDQLGKNNAMISTASIQEAVAMAWAGAAGETADEMAKALNYSEDAHEALNKIDELILSGQMPASETEMEKMDAIEVSIANDLYLAPDYSWAEDWLDMLAKHYDTGITEMNFAADTSAAVKYINQAVSDATHERITNLLPDGSITRNTKLVITNAIYFKAPWADQFNLAGDLKLEFTKLDGGKAEVPYIVNSKHYNYIKTDNYQAVSVPLRSRKYHMMFIMPDEGKFESVEASLSGEEMTSILAGMTSNSEIKMRIPVYKFDTSLALKAPLQARGMNKAFADADFSKMTKEGNDLYISEIYHKTFIGVDEHGVEAAAATAVVMPGKGIDENPPVEFYLDRPFYFVIYETKSQSPMFVGRVMDPA